MEYVILGGMAVYALYLFSLDRQKRTDVFGAHSKILIVGVIGLVVLSCLFRLGCDCSGGGGRYGDY